MEAERPLEASYRHDDQPASARSQLVSPISLTASSASAASGGFSDGSPGTNLRPARSDGSPSSPILMRAHISTRFRAERALLAMAQRNVSWQGPELWVVTASSRYEVKVGPPVRDLPPADDPALAVVRRTIGMNALAQLMIVQDGCVVGPWVPSEVRQSREHVVCVTPDVLPSGEGLPAQCPEEVMGLLAGYAQRRLQPRQGAAAGAASDAIPSAHAASDAWAEEGDREDEEAEEGDGEEPFEDEHEPSADDEEQVDSWRASPQRELEAECETAYHYAAGLELELEDGAVLDSARVRDAIYASDGEDAAVGEAAESDDDEHADAALGEQEMDLEEMDLEAVLAAAAEELERDDDSAADIGDDAPAADALPAPAEEGEPPNPEPPVAESAAAPAASAPVDEVVRADQFVHDARNAWLQAKDPQRQSKPLQQLFTRQEGTVTSRATQEGTDLRGLHATPAFDDENAGEAADDDSARQRASEATTKPAVEAARGRWGQVQPVLAPARQPSATRPTAQPRRGGKLKRAEEGGPAGIVPPTGHMQRLEQLRMRTVQARTVWQTAGALEALRLVTTHDDSALSLSVLRAIADRLSVLGAAELAVALALARPLLASGTASVAVKPLTALLRAAKRSASEDEDPTATAAARASMLRETRGLCTQLDELRVTKDGARAASFEEQFAFGQALALAREAGREAWRALDGSGAADAAPSRPSGRRAW